ncbi:MAG TPA: DUF3153 domain-containing protein [Candidatus Avacidaminococcus intestinavium]|uniref:DUF3153 domain-containing protein n=1 Tax=Candidatus Avacidaminococcus intestinavium TaxID=2840684 RepID=A0A9D1SLE8_9FIRM|nr:DUF3153 domain-containing protein [Candidatus Avacidaminococcus intestinavium]
MKKRLVLFCLVFLAMLASGCVKGDVILEVSRFGSADVECKIVAVPLVAGQLNALQADFERDGFFIEQLQEEKMEGFLAKKHFERIEDLGKVQLFRGVRSKDNKKDAGKFSGVQETKQSSLGSFSYKPGILFDTVIIDADVDLRGREEDTAQENEWLVKNILQQVQLRFVLKLPTTSTTHNATSTPDDGQTLIWKLILGEKNKLQAEVTYLNPFKVALGIGIIIITGLGFVFYRRRKLAK